MPNPSTKKWLSEIVVWSLPGSRSLNSVLHQDLDRFFDLRIFAFSDALGVVSHFDVRFHLRLLHELTFFVAQTDFWNAEEKLGILQEFPPDGCSCAGDRHANHFSDSQMLVNPGKQVGIGIIAFTGKDDALF